MGTVERLLQEIDKKKPSSEYLLSALRVYCTFLAGAFCIYCILRRKIPRFFAVRQWVPEIKSPGAVDQFGHISWLWKVYSFPTEELREHIGLDALCFLRFMNMGFRMSCIGAFNSLWLFPVYLTAEPDEWFDGSCFDDDIFGFGEDDLANITTPTMAPTACQRLPFDPVDRLAINNLPLGSMRFIAPVIGSYIFFGYCMYTILKEFRWFIEQRHIWLRKFNQRNYTILVREIPEELRSNDALKEHFQMLYGMDRVLESNISLYIRELVARNSKRKAIVANLEHALAEFSISGKRPRRRLIFQSRGNTSQVVGDNVTKKKKTEAQESDVDSIDYYTQELSIINAEIDERINKTIEKQRPKLGQKSKTFRRHQSSLSTNNGGSRSPFSSMDCVDAGAGQDSVADSTREKLKTVADKENEDTSEVFGEEASSSDANLASNFVKADSFKSKLTETRSAASGIAKTAGLSVRSKAERLAKKRMKQAKSTVSNASEVATLFLVGGEEGTVDNAAFITFSSLVAVHSALQMSQHATPFVMECETAPDIPKHVIWKNVGKDKEARQAGKLLSLVVTASLCAFWTALVTFIVQLTNVETLRKSFDTLDKTLEQYKGLSGLLSLVSPLVLLAFNTGLLPIILRFVSKWEFPASESLLEASAFWKMAAFTIIQTFFVVLFSGSAVDAALKYFFSSPGEYFYVLARGMVKHSSYFMSLLIVSTCVGSIIELYRIVPLIQLLGRKLVGRRLTAKERSQRVGVLRPLSDVDKFYFSRVQARFLLYFLVNFVYSSITPLVNWFCLVFFLFLGSVYRHQFLFNFPSTPDTGGQIWLSFMRVLLACFIIAQLTLLFVLASAQSVAGAVMMAPLLAVCLIFVLYLHQRHFRIGEHLPARESLRQDLENADDGVDYNEFLGDYKHPALKERFLDAEWDYMEKEDEEMEQDDDCELVNIVEEGKVEVSEDVPLIKDKHGGGGVRLEKESPDDDSINGGNDLSEGTSREQVGDENLAQDNGSKGPGWFGF